MKVSTSRRSAFCASIAAALLAACGGSQPPVGAPGAMRSEAQPARGSIGRSFLQTKPLGGRPYHHTFKYTGARQSFRVPSGVSRINIVARGAAGGGILSYRSTSGLGGRAFAEIPVHPGETLYVFVGGAGVELSGGRFYGGFNGGGNPGRFEFGFGGGGASDVREGGARTKDRILVAAGGGGQGGYGTGGGAGGVGGGLVGRPGSEGGYYNSGRGGGGATQSQGGNRGRGARKECYWCTRGHRGVSGRLGMGGDGGKGGLGETSDTTGGAGGGGGGGYFGGGGGGGGEGGGGGGSGTAGGGGGGGSSYIEPSALKFRTWSGWKNATGDGLVVFSWQ